jgi:hypothetical protein
MKQWDVFLSHATEDKEAVVLPLAHALLRAGVRIWLDKFEIRLGDSLRAKIDEGLALSRFGVVVLSDDFFRKLWSGRELDGLFARDVVLPIWHGLDQKAVARYSPMLAAKAAASTADGIEGVARQIIDRIYLAEESDDTAVPGSARRFASLLGDGRDVADVAAFLAENPPFLTRTFGLHRDDLLRERAVLGGVTIDYCTAMFQPTSGRHDDWRIVLLGPPSDLHFVGSAPTPALQNLIDRAEAVRGWVSANLASARSILPNLRSNFLATLIVGRRPQPGSPVSRALADLNDELVGINVRTYDWLLDTAFTIDDDRGGD